MIKTAFDLDGVLADTTYSIYKKCIQLYGIDIRKTDNRTHHIKVKGVSNDEISKVINECVGKDWESLQLCPGVYDALHLFYSYYYEPITIVTARNKNHAYVKEGTYSWLKKHFPDITFKVCFTPGRLKLNYLKEYDFKVFVEDRLKTANHISTELKRVYLINKSYNINRETNSNVRRVDSFKEAINSILEGAK